MSHEQEQCTYCSESYPKPIAYHHSTEECRENEARNKASSPSDKRGADAFSLNEASIKSNAPDLRKALPQRFHHFFDMLVEQALREPLTAIERVRRDQAGEPITAKQAAEALRTTLSHVAHTQECKAVLVDAPRIGTMNWCEPCGLYFGKDQACPGSARSTTRQNNYDDEIEGLRVVAQRRGCKIKQGDVIAVERAVIALLEKAKS